MFIDRVFNNLKKSSAKSNLRNFLSNIGNNLVKEAEEEITLTDESVDYDKSSNTAAPLDEDAILEHELNKLAAYYRRSKASLENKTFNPQVLTITERVLINRAKVEIKGGFFEGYIFKNYSKGRVHLYSSEHVLRVDQQVVVPKDPNNNPLRHTSLEAVYAYLDIECRFPQACLRDLSMEIAYFNKFKTKEELAYLESRFSELADNL